MTIYTVTIDFPVSMTEEDAIDWLDTVDGAFPKGTTMKWTKEPQIINVEDLGKKHIGRQVSLWVDSVTGSVQGKLGGVYPAGRQGTGRTLIINGNAHTVQYGSVRVDE